MEPNGKLWNLLGKAPLKEANSWFSTRVLARNRNQPKSFYASFLTLKWGWITALSASFLLSVSFWYFELKPLEDSKKNQEAFNYLIDRRGDSELWRD